MMMGTIVAKLFTFSVSVVGAIAIVVVVVDDGFDCSDRYSIGTFVIIGFIHSTIDFKLFK